MGSIGCLVSGGLLLVVGGDDREGSRAAGAPPAPSGGPPQTPSEAPPEPLAGREPPETAADEVAPDDETTPDQASGPGVRVAAVGDIAVNRAAGAVGLFAGVDADLRGDVVLGNLEGTLSRNGTSKCAGVPPERTATCFAFRTDPSFAEELAAAGFTTLNLANNHSLDFGATGLAETITSLGAADLRATGHAGSSVVRRVERSGLDIAVLGFAPYPYTNPLLNIEAATNLVRRADESADLVIVTMHAGAEGSDRASVTPGPETFLGEARGDPVAFSRAVIDAGADLVVGHGPHILRGMEFYEGRLIAYSLGNFATRDALSVDGDTRNSAILQVALAPDGEFRDGRLVPVELSPAGSPEPGGDAIERVRALSNQDFGAAAARLGAAGRIRPPAP